MLPGWHFARLVVTFSTTPPPGYDPQPVIPDPDHPHAVSEVQRPGGTDTYSYDDTGSLTARTEAGTTYSQTTNAEGPLVRVEKTASGEVWTFAYDGDGNQIKRTNPDGTSTLYLAGGLYEVSLDAAGQQTAVRRYYLLAGQRLAMRDASGTSYLLTDHIGSVVAVLDGSGAVLAEQRYKPFGQLRLTPGIGQTDVGFTGQRSLAAAGLQDFNARWLDSSLGMFAGPDSLIANPYNPQSLNPYGYVMNNPLRYTDPTGLYVFEEAPTDKYVSVSDPRVRSATRTSDSRPPNTRSGSPAPAPTGTGGVQERAEPSDTVLGGRDRAVPGWSASEMPNDPGRLTTDQPDGLTVTAAGSIPIPFASDSICLRVDCPQALAGAGLILVTDLLVGLPAAAVIILTGGATPTAVAAEVVELVVVVPVNLFGLYLIVDAMAPVEEE